MENLLKQIETLKSSKLKDLVDLRIKEFEETGKQEDKIFSELCFCLMTANFQAERSIKIQEQLCNLFPILPQEELAQKLKEAGHRFPNKRAEFIFEARKTAQAIPQILKQLKGQELRNWLAENIKGLGLKEASHFLRNLGYTDYALIDFHIIDLLVREKLIEKPKTLTQKKYLEIEALLRKIGEKTGLNLAELDLYLWYIETNKVLK